MHLKTAGKIYLSKNLKETSAYESEQNMRDSESQRWPENGSHNWSSKQLKDNVITALFKGYNTLLK